MNELDIYKPSLTFARVKNYKNCPRFIAPCLDPIKESWDEARAAFPILKGKKDHLYIGLFTIQTEVIQELICTHRDGFILPERLGLLIAIFDEDKKIAKFARYVKKDQLPGQRRGSLVWNPNYGTNKQSNLKIWKIEFCKAFRIKISEAFKNTPTLFKIVSSRFKRNTSSKR